MFWVLMFFCRQELGIKGVVFWVAVWLGLFSLFFFSGIPAGFFVAAQALIDIGLFLFLFGGDVRIT
jgi:hypothetical protein